jgi:enoyl-[acyl-carrier protein] reductase I
MALMQDKRVLVAGVRNKWSIGWHCALSLQREGARLAFSVFSEREKADVEKLLNASGLGNSPVLLCDATSAEDVERLYGQLSAVFDGALDGLVHSMAFAKREDLAGRFVDTSHDGWDVAMGSSAFSLVSLARGAQPLMRSAGGGSIVTLTYLGGVRVIPNYNVMGVAKAALEASVRYLASDLGPENIRVNAVSAGPIKTLAAQGISGFGAMLQYVAEKAPMRRGVDADEVGDAAAFLLSPLARGITGETLYVDAGYHIMGM